MQRITRKTNGVWRSAAVCLLAVAALAAGHEASAQSFSYNISTSEALLENPDDMMVQKIEMWDSPLMRIIKRSRPFIEVTNTSSAGSGQLLTMFTMTIGDTDFNFSDDVLGAYAATGYSTPGAIASSSSSSGGDAITISFANGGLAPGEIARFQFDIDPDPGTGGYVHPDFRTVMFDLDDNGSDADNSELTALFVRTGPGTQTLVSTTIPDQDLPPGMPLYSQGLIRSYDVEEPLDNFGGDAETVIPEPSSVVLTLLAACGALAGMMRRRLG